MEEKMGLDTLLTTVISSTAALVAIIGGFLVSRVIALASEQGGMKRKLREINSDIEANEGSIRKVKESLHEEKVNDFIGREGVIRGALQKKELATVIDKEEYYDLKVEELRPHFECLGKIAEEIKDRKIQSLKDLNEKEQHLLFPKRLSWYKHIIEYFETSNERVQRDSIEYKLRTSHQPRSPKTNKEANNKGEELWQMEIKKTILLTQKKEQKRILEDFGKPKYVTSGLIILAYAAIVGIIYPSTLLPYSTNTYDDTLTKWWILSLFFSHIGAIFVYLFMAMRGLSRNFEDKKKPEN